jgi:hypothetical protein
MEKCYIDFHREVCEGLIGTKAEVKEFLKGYDSHYDYEGKQRIRNRENHSWEYVIVYSYATYKGTGFVCYKAE